MIQLSCGGVFVVEIDTLACKRVDISESEMYPRACAIVEADSSSLLNAPSDFAPV